MSKNGKIDYPLDKGDREDVRWFENYEKCGKTKHLERLKKKDILNYIRDVEQNCRLEVSSGDEDYAGTRKSSDCSVIRCSGTRFRSLRENKSKVTSRKNKNVALERKPKRSAVRNATECNRCCSAQKFHFPDDLDLTVRENSKSHLDISSKPIYQHPSLSRNSNKCRASSPTFYGWYSRRDRKAWPTVTEMASLEVTKDWSRSAIISDSRINKSKITDGKSTKIRTFKSLRRRKRGDSTHTKIYPSVAPDEKTTEREPCYCVLKQGGEARMRKLNEGRDASDSVNQQPIYFRQNSLSYQAPKERNGGYKERYTSGYHPVRRSGRPTSWDLNSRSNRLTVRLPPEASSLLRGRTSRWETTEIESPLKASSSIMEASIDSIYQRETKRKNNTDQRRRGPGNVLGERQVSSCYRRPGLLRESGKLCKVVRTREDKQRLGCCCENAERDETAECSRYCRCPENVNDPTRAAYESTRRRSVAMSKRANYAATLRRTLPKSIQSRDNDGGKSAIDLSAEEDSRNEDATFDNRAFDVPDDARTNAYDGAGAVDLEYSKPRASFPDGTSEATRECGRSSNDLKSDRREEVLETRAALRNRITAHKYPAGSRRDAAESTCECKEPFHDPPAACSVGSCACIGNDESAERNDDDLSRRTSDTTVWCCCYCSCSSPTSQDEDPVKKLESFCERVKAVNQDVFHEPTSRSNATRTNAREYNARDSDEQNQFEHGGRRAGRGARLAERERLADPTRLRLEKPRHSHDGAKILIYPPRGEGGPPLTLYKRSSDISCRVKGDADTGFRYSVTYVQKFVSPTWMPSLAPGVSSRGVDEGCGRFVDYG